METMEAVEGSAVVKERQRVLFGVVDRLLAVHADWIDSDAQVITEAFGNAVVACQEAFSTGMLPERCRVLNDRMVALLAEWRKWDEANQLSRHEILPGNSFWKAFDNLVNARKSAEPKPTTRKESIAELTGQGVSENQIAKIYGWRDEDGTPQVWKVREEKAHPGRHTGGVAPVERLQKEREAKEAAKREKQKLRLAQKMKAVNAPAPEGLEKLVADGVSAQQIAKLLKFATVDDVFAECDKRGIPRPAVNYELPAAVQSSIDLSDEDRDEIDAIVAEGEAALTLEQRIIQRHLAGLKSAEIADELSAVETEPVAWQKVAAITRRFDADPEAFGEIPAPVAAGYTVGLDPAADDSDAFDGVDPFASVE